MLSLVWLMWHMLLSVDKPHGKGVLSIEKENVAVSVEDGVVLCCGTARVGAVLWFQETR